MFAKRNLVLFGLGVVGGGAIIGGLRWLWNRTKTNTLNPFNGSSSSLSSESNLDQNKSKTDQESNINNDNKDNKDINDNKHDEKRIVEPNGVVIKGVVMKGVDAYYRFFNDVEKRVNDKNNDTDQKQAIRNVIQGDFDTYWNTIHKFQSDLYFAHRKPNGRNQIYIPPDTVPIGPKLMQTSWIDIPWIRIWVSLAQDPVSTTAEIRNVFRILWKGGAFAPFILEPCFEDLIWDLIFSMDTSSPEYCKVELILSLLLSTPEFQSCFWIPSLISHQVQLNRWKVHRVYGIGGDLVFSTLIRAVHPLNCSRCFSHLIRPIYIDSIIYGLITTTQEICNQMEMIEIANNNIGFKVKHEFSIEEKNMESQNLLLMVMSARSTLQSKFANGVFQWALPIDDLCNLVAHYCLDVGV